MDDDSYDFENYSAPSGSSIDDLESRIETLESEKDTSHAAGGGIPLGYGLGMCIAVVLSWSRNASILWCIAHGICSWLYVIYVPLSDWYSSH